jgi:hypothetical protein
MWTLNGNAPSSVEEVEFDEDGTFYSLYTNGDRRPIYQIPLADVPSPDKLIRCPATSTARRLIPVMSGSGSRVRAVLAAGCRRA